MYIRDHRDTRRGVVQMSEEVQEEIGKNVQQLVGDLQKRDIYGGLQVIDSLAKIGEPAVDPLVDLLTNGPPNTRWRSAMALARVGEFSVDPLIEVAATQDVSIRNPAIWALSEIGSSKAVEPLIRIMQEEESECCRILTAAALLKINDPAGVEAVNREYERSGEEFRGRVDEAFSGS
jgi:HEAT repeat protein